MNLAGWLEVPRKSVVMHNAGNDANLTMKILLILAVKSCRGRLTNLEKERLDLLVKIFGKSRPCAAVDIDTKERDGLMDEKKKARREDWMADC